MPHRFHFPTLKLANRVFYAMAGVSLFLAIFITPPLIRLLEYHLIFGIVELWLVRFALFLMPVFFVVMAILTRRLDKELCHYTQTLVPKQTTHP